MNLKPIYFDLRLGGITLNPLIAVINFLMLSYLVIENMIPFVLFVPLFFVGIFALYAFIGNKFRHIQQTTDNNLLYEKQTQQAKTNLIILQALDILIKNSKTNYPKDFEERLEYLSAISTGKK